MASSRRNLCDLTEAQARDRALRMRELLGGVPWEIRVWHNCWWCYSVELRVGQGYLSVNENKDLGTYWCLLSLSGGTGGDTRWTSNIGNSKHPARIVRKQLRAALKVVLDELKAYTGLHDALVGVLPSGKKKGKKRGTKSK